MNQAEAVRRAMVELGDVPAEELAAFIGTKYGVRLPLHAFSAACSKLSKEMTCSHKLSPWRFMLYHCS